VTHVWAVILGLVQGLAEFLPISSSAHLTLIPWIFGLQHSAALAFTSTVQFDIALHAGSTVAILIALWGDWVVLAKGVVGREPGQLKLAGFLLLTSVPGAIFGVLLEEKVQTVFRAPWLIGSTLIVFGILLWAADRFTARQDPFGSMTWQRAGWIGLAQAAAIVPGVSRSGATITVGRALGLSREGIAKYSFMAALPIIAGGAVFGLRHVPISELLSLDWVLGFVAAAISSFVFMRLMLRYLHKHSFSVFMWYRIALGVFVIGLFLIRG
jgi:undecaprenyl-diphosphatase